MNIRDIKREAKQVIKKHWGFGLLISVISFAIYGLFPEFIDILASGGFHNYIVGDNSASILGSLLSMLISLIVFPIVVGSYWVYLRLVRGETAQISDIFIPITNANVFIKTILTTLLAGIFTILWSLLFIIPGIIKSIAYSQVYYILKDHPEYSPNQAITKSRELMDGNKWKYFVFGLSFIGWWLLCLVTIGLALIWVVPYYSTAAAKFYDQLSDHRSKALESEIIL